MSDGKPAAPAASARPKGKRLTPKQRHRHQWIYLGGRIGWQCQTCWRVETGPGHTEPAAARLRGEGK